MMRTAQMIVEECVALRPGEQVAVIGDTETVPIAEVLAQAAHGAGGEVVVCIMTPREQHGNEPPPILAAAMQASDVMLMAVTHSITHTTARKEASARGARACVLRSVTIATMGPGASRDGRPWGSMDSPQNPEPSQPYPAANPPSSPWRGAHRA